MEIRVEDQSSTRKFLIVNLGAEEVKGIEKEVLKDFLAHASLPGFRKGKVPEGVVRNKYKKEIVGELISKVVGKAYEFAKDGAGFDFYQIVRAEPLGDIAVGQEAEVKFVVDILPEFNLPEYKGITLEVEKSEISAEEREEAIKRKRAELVEYNIVAKGAKKGDYVKLDYTGKIDGVLINDIVPEKAIYGTQLGTWTEAGSEDDPSVRCVVDGVLGMKAGAEKTVEYDFPEDFQVKELAGKHAVYELKAHEVREKHEPELSEAQIAEIEKKLVENLGAEKKAHAKDKLSEYLLAQTNFDLPESAIEEAKTNIMKRYMRSFLNFGMSEDKLMENKDSILKMADEFGPKNAKLHIITGKIAKLEKIEITNEDLSKTMMMMCMASGMKPEQFMTELKQDRSQVEDMRQSTLNSKVLDFLISQSSVKETEVSSKKEEI